MAELGTYEDGAGHRFRMTKQHAEKVGYKAVSGPPETKAQAQTEPEPEPTPEPEPEPPEPTPTRARSGSDPTRRSS
ncbi:MAG TPA: hypothetical protein VII06_09665 [Chloroflexota bacterium]|jgi:hypothetical protein